MRLRLIIATMGALAGVLVLSSTTLASVKQVSGNPTPQCPSPLVFSGKKASCVPCPKGTQYEAGKCKVAPVPACPAGYKFDAKTAKCAAVTAAAPPAVVKTTVPGCVTLQNGTTVCNQQATSVRSESDRQVATVSLDSSGTIQARFTMHNGLTQAMMQKATTCLVAGNVTRAARPGEKCGTIKIGTPITNSGILITTHAFGLFADVVHPGDAFYLIGKQWYKRKCGNKVWLKFSQQPHPKMPVLPYGRVVAVQDFTYKVKMTLTVHLHSSVNATAQCKLGDSTNGSAAGGGATGTDDQSITLSAVATGATEFAATDMAHQIIISSKEVLDLQGKVVAAATSNLQAKAWATCSYTPPTPTPTPVCPSGWSGTYPNCVPPSTPTPTPVCPSGWSGTYPNCVPPSTPTPTPVCPSGWSGTYPNCTAPYAKILGVTDLNDIPAGQSSTNWYVSTNFSSAGTITVDPGNNKVMQCGGSTWTTGFLQVPVASGNGVQTCFVFLAPTDASTTTNTIKVSSAVPGAQPDSATDTYAISHPATNRPQSTG